MHSSIITSHIAELNAFSGKKVKIKQAIAGHSNGRSGDKVDIETTFSMSMDFVDFNIHRGMLKIGDVNNEAKLEFDSDSILHIRKIGNTIVFIELLHNVLERKTIIY